MTKFEGNKAIVEGDFYSSIQWGSDIVTCPWCLADWIYDSETFAMFVQSCAKRWECSPRWSSMGRSFILNLQGLVVSSYVLFFDSLLCFCADLQHFCRVLCFG